MDAMKALVRAENPTFPESFNGKRVDITAQSDPAGYEERVTFQAQWRLDRQAIDASEANGKTRRKQFVSGMARLRENLRVLLSTSTTNPNWSAMNAAQRTEALRQVAIDSTQAILWIGEILQDFGQIDQEDGS